MKHILFVSFIGFVNFAGALLPSLSLASVNPGPAVWQRSATVNQCAKAQNEIKTWWREGTPMEGHVLTARTMARARTLLRKIRFPTAEERHWIQSELTQNFSDSFLQWRSVVGADCPSVRLVLGQAMINTAKAEPSQKAAVQRELKTMLAAQKYPALLDVIIDSVLVSYGLTSGFWTVDPLTANEAARLRSDLKEDTHSWSDQYATLFARINTSYRSSAPTTVAKFKAEEVLSEVRSGVANEMAIVEKYADRLGSLVAQLK